MEETRILVVDDEQEIADLLELYLISDGYQVIKSEDALEGLAIMEREKIDLVLLDIMMPKMDGLEMCRKIREKHNVPIIMVSAKTQELDKIVVFVDGESIKLTPIEFDILYLLASHPGRGFSTDEIFEKVWNEKVYEANNTVMVHIRRLRGKMKDDTRTDKIITTVWGVGYKIEQ